MHFTFTVTVVLESPEEVDKTEAWRLQEMCLEPLQMVLKSWAKKLSYCVLYIIFYVNYKPSATNLSHLGKPLVTPATSQWTNSWPLPHKYPHGQTHSTRQQHPSREEQSPKLTKKRIAAMIE